MPYGWPKLPNNLTFDIFGLVKGSIGVHSHKVFQACVPLVLGRTSSSDLIMIQLKQQQQHHLPHKQWNFRYYCTYRSAKFAWIFLLLSFGLNLNRCLIVINIRCSPAKWKCRVDKIECNRCYYHDRCTTILSVTTCSATLSDVTFEVLSSREHSVIANNPASKVALRCNYILVYCHYAHEYCSSLLFALTYIHDQYLWSMEERKEQGMHTIYRECLLICTRYAFLSTDRAIICIATWIVAGMAPIHSS